jgi:hypothetical protein
MRTFGRRREPRHRTEVDLAKIETWLKGDPPMLRLLHIPIIIGLLVLFVFAVLTSNGPGSHMAEQHSDVRLL